MELISRSERGCTDAATQGLGFITKDSVAFWVKSQRPGRPPAAPRQPQS